MSNFCILYSSRKMDKWDGIKVVGICTWLRYASFFARERERESEKERVREREREREREKERVRERE
jgi:hypothetical protein